MSSECKLTVRTACERDAQEGQTLNRIPEFRTIKPIKVSSIRDPSHAAVFHLRTPSFLGESSGNGHVGGRMDVGKYRR